MLLTPFRTVDFHQWIKKGEFLGPRIPWSSAQVAAKESNFPQAGAGKVSLKREFLNSAIDSSRINQR